MDSGQNIHAAGHNIYYATLRMGPMKQLMNGYWCGYLLLRTYLTHLYWTRPQRFVNGQ